MRHSNKKPRRLVATKHGAHNSVKNGHKTDSITEELRLQREIYDRGQMLFRGGRVSIGGDGHFKVKEFSDVEETLLPFLSPSTGEAQPLVVRRGSPLSVEPVTHTVSALEPTACTCSAFKRTKRFCAHVYATIAFIRANYSKYSPESRVGKEIIVESPESKAATGCAAEEVEL